MKIKFYGVRGSIPSPGKDTVKYGGNTACVEIVIRDDYSVVFDAGSGIRELGRQYLENKIKKGMPVRMSLFITHTHWDHIQGFPFFIPAFVGSSEIKIIGAAKVDAKLDETLKSQQNYQNFPVALYEMKGKPTFMEIEEDQTVGIHFNKREKGGFDIGYNVNEAGNVNVRSKKLNHPYPGVFAYRLEYNGKVVVFATDTEHYSTVDSRLVKLAQDADVLIYDCQYTDEKYNEGESLSWGHSTPTEGIKVAKAAGVKKLVMFHYDPNSTDIDINRMWTDAVKQAGDDLDVVAASEGLEIDLG